MIGQTSLADVLAPIVTVTRGPEDRPTDWTVSYPDGRAWHVTRTSDPARVWVTRHAGDDGIPMAAWDVPAPSTVREAS